MLEIQREVHSSVWNNNIKGNSVNILFASSIALILNTKFFLANPTISFFIGIFYTFAVSLVVVVEYLLIKPILKRGLNLFRLEYSILFTFSLSISFILIKVIPQVKLPVFSELKLLYLYILLFLLITLYFGYMAIRISEGYRGLGFVQKPFYAVFIGTISIVLSFLTLLWGIEDFNSMYYYIILFFGSGTFAFIYYGRFVVGYPSLLQPKWKALMPFDLVKVATTFTLAFLAISFYFTIQDFGIIFSIPLWPLAIVAGILIPTAALFIYSRAFAGETTLSYWNYIKTEIAAHLGLTLYVLSTAIVLWGFLENIERMFYGIFFVLSYFFYVTAALDMRKLTQDLKVPVQYHPLTILRYLVSIFASFFIIYFIVLLTKGRATSLDTLFERYPYFPLALIGIFFVFYFTSLKRTHKGFEQLMKKGTITDISYLSSLGVFIALFLLYLRIRGPSSLLSQFPLFGTVFIGYFAILIAEVHSTTTLRIKEYKEKKDITDLLNSVAGHFFRTDILGEMWNEVIETYKGLDPELERARFYPPDRTFDMSMVNDKARVTASLAMLQKMERSTKEEGAPVVPFDINLKKDSENLLGEKILLLPEEFSKNFKGEMYYPKLLESTFNRINEAIMPFVSSKDYENILKKLVKVDLFFKNLSFEASGVKIKRGIDLTRKDFLKYLKLYIQGLENTFPFNRLLLRETVKSEVQNRLALYGFTQADVLNVVPSGVKELDEVLYGGLIKGTSTLFLSEERRAKNDVLFMFIAEGLKEKENGIYSTSRISSKDLLEAFKRTIKTPDKLTLIDLYLATHTDNVVKIPVSRDGSQIISTSLIQVRQSLVAAIKKYPKEAHKRVVLDIYSDLARYQKLEEISDLVIRQIEGFKRWNCTSIVTLAPNLSNEDIERHFDNVLLLTDVSTIKIKKLFGGKPKKDTFIIWGTYAPIEEPDYPLFFEA
jgi:KaiC/GvpD/RAD55 family RecA-like ATPase